MCAVDIGSSFVLSMIFTATCSGSEYSQPFLNGTHLFAGEHMTGHLDHREVALSDGVLEVVETDDLRLMAGQRGLAQYVLPRLGTVARGCRSSCGAHIFAYSIVVGRSRHLNRNVTRFKSSSSTKAAGISNATNKRRRVRPANWFPRCEILNPRKTVGLENCSFNFWSHQAGALTLTNVLAIE